MLDRHAEYCAGLSYAAILTSHFMGLADVFSVLYRLLTQKQKAVQKPQVI